MKTYETEWCCPDTDAVWDVLVEYTPEEVCIETIYRKEPYIINGVETGMEWQEWNGESDADYQDWVNEIRNYEAQILEDKYRGEEL